MKNVYQNISMDKKVALFIILSSLLTGCSWIFYDRFQEFYDEFRNSRKAIVRMDIRPLESRTEIGNANIIFEREYSEQYDIVKAYIVIERSSSSFKIGDQGFFKIDNDSYEISLEKIVSEQKMKTESTISSFSKTDSTTVSSGSSTESDTRIWIDDKFVFTLTNDMINKIKTSENLIFRFYFGPIPGTFRIKGTDLNLLKKILL